MTNIWPIASNINFGGKISPNKIHRELDKMKKLTQYQVIERIKENLETGREPPLSGLFFKNGDPVSPHTAAYNLWHTQIFEKPRTRTINEIEVPAPETEMPDMGDVYWYLSSAYDQGVSSFQWGADDFDSRIFRSGIWLNEEDAIANAKALMA